jgi:hypothetical protein
MAARPTTTKLAGSACRRAYPLSLRRPFSAAAARASSNQTSLNPQETSLSLPPSRWTSELPARIGKCLSFGCNAQQVSQAAAVLRVIATEWKDLLASSEGFLTGGRRGLDAREIAWGEMDTFVGIPSRYASPSPRSAVGARKAWEHETDTG